ncbi:MAG: GNAT family N-acetyltransferase [Chitinophagaceae bacterium]
MNTKPMHEDIIIKIATTAAQFEDGRILFRKYAASLSIDLSFQDFEHELSVMNKQYNEPKGALLIAYKNSLPIGCVAIRESERNIAELKRMYVDPGYRRLKLGKNLLQSAIDTARELNYQFIRLDTLPEMKQALELYRSFGFYEIQPYRFNPVNGAVFMEKKLD